MHHLSWLISWSYQKDQKQPLSIQHWKLNMLVQLVFIVKVEKKDNQVYVAIHIINDIEKFHENKMDINGLGF